MVILTATVSLTRARIFFNVGSITRTFVGAPRPGLLWGVVTTKWAMVSAPLALLRGGCMAALPLPYGAALRAAKTTGLKGAACKMRPAL